MSRYGEKMHAFAERADDLYETPPEAVEALCRHVVLPVRLWEPCAGRGAISRVLRFKGHDVVASDLIAYAGADADIETPVDVLEVDEAPHGVTTIVTNPPFKAADTVIRHCLTLCSTVIVLQRLTALEGANRSDLIDGHLDRVYVGKERLPMMHRDGWAGNRTTSSVCFAWFVFVRWRAAGPIDLCRVSWRNGAL